MARPQKEGLDYFPHDTDAVNDEKIEALRALHGNDGYAFYFILLERIYRSPQSQIDISDTETLQILARKVSVTNDKFSEMMKTALKWRCFDPDKYKNRHILTSNGIKKRALPVVEKRVSMRLKYQKVNIPTPISPTETIPETPQSKVKNSKVKNSKEINKEKKKQYGKFHNVFLLDKERGELIEKFGQQGFVERAEKLSIGIESKGYKYKSHYATILNWERMGVRNGTHQENNNKVRKPTGNNKKDGGVTRDYSGRYRHLAK